MQAISALPTWIVSRSLKDKLKDKVSKQWSLMLHCMCIVQCNIIDFLLVSERFQCYSEVHSYESFAITW